MPARSSPSATPLGVLKKTPCSGGKGHSCHNPTPHILWPLFCATPWGPLRPLDPRASQGQFGEVRWVVPRRFHQTLSVCMFLWFRFRLPPLRTFNTPTGTCAIRCRRTSTSRSHTSLTQPSSLSRHGWLSPPNKATTDFMSWAERSFLNRKKIDAFPKTLAKENVSEHVAETANFNNSQE